VVNRLVLGERQSALQLRLVPSEPRRAVAPVGRVALLCERDEAGHVRGHFREGATQRLLRGVAVQVEFESKGLNRDIKPLS
jgi:hypothetical protein